MSDLSAVCYFLTIVVICATSASQGVCISRLRERLDDLTEIVRIHRERLDRLEGGGE